MPSRRKSSAPCPPVKSDASPTALSSTHHTRPLYSFVPPAPSPSPPGGPTSWCRGGSSPLPARRTHLVVPGRLLPPSPPGGPTSWCRGGSLLPPRPEDPPRGAGAAPRSARGAPPPPAAAAAARCRTPSPCPGPTPETRPRSLRPGPRRCNNHVTRVSSRDKGQLHVTRVSPRDKGQLT